MSAPWLIPYVDHYDGERRMLTLDLTTGNAMAQSRHVPIVSIDGRQYVVVWGRVVFEIPAERNTHLSVHVEGEYLTQHVSTLLPAGPEPLGLRYETHYMSGVGSLAPLPTPG